jgi:hypothetical protein
VRVKGDSTGLNSKTRPTFIFFGRWRQRTGLTALAVSCAILAAWIRSSVSQDSLELNLGRGETLQLVSAKQSLSVSRMAGRSPVEFTFEWSLGDGKFRGVFPPGRSVLRGPSFGYDVMSVPYIALVVPFSAISAWLLLKPRHAAPHKVTVCN